MRARRILTDRLGGARREGTECFSESIRRLSLPRFSLRSACIASSPNARSRAANFAEAHSATSRSAGDSESSADPGRAKRGQLLKSTDRREPVGVLPDCHRRTDRLTGQRLSQNRRRGPVGFPSVQPVRAGRGGTAVDFGFWPHFQSGQPALACSLKRRPRMSRPRAMTCSLQVNRSYFDVLHAQAVVKVAEETVQCAPVAERSGNRARPGTI